MKARTSEKVKEQQRVPAGWDLLPPLADGFLADLLLAAGGREAEGDIEQKFNLLLLSWHSRSRRREVFSCEVAKGKGTTGILKTTQRLVGFCSICPDPGAGRRFGKPPGRST